ncbi:hypothetical protein NX784_22460 [Massilia pinisoli]|uniref:Bulb-type lectin domain-containing protein n=1 Tax=Massilia pinisoli TaxID=1772194 RepID=A0ABT1ZWQ0_9BURK|nr:hypothetical protein [Massilia pinisoli]MCS0584358.1 hypothetical protein [Massilia pinisoli]
MSKKLAFLLGAAIFSSTCLAEDRLEAGQALASGAFLMSASGAYLLSMQSGGTLVLLRQDGSTVRTFANGGTGTILLMAVDGNLVEVTPTGKVVWSTKTNGACPCQHPPALTLLDSGNMIIWAGQPPLLNPKFIWQLGDDPSPLPVNNAMTSYTFPGTRPGSIPDPVMPQSL